MRGGGLCRLLLFLPATAGAQVAPNRAAQYLEPTDVTDARAVWVNPAGLGRAPEASVHFDITVADPGAAGRLRQLTLGLASRGFAFGYQRDVFPGGGRGHTYRIAMASGHQRLAGGLAGTLYRGGTSATGWDLGAAYDIAPGLTVGGVIANVGRPAVRDSVQPVTFIPAATLRLAGPRVAISAHGRATSAALLGYAFAVRAGLREGTTRPLRLLVRLDTNRSLERAAFALGLSVGGADVLGGVATTPGDVSRIDAVSLYAVSSRRLGR